MDVNEANASISSVNTGLSSMEQAAAKAAHGASAGIGGFTVSMVKAVRRAPFLADAIKHAVEWIKEWTIEAANSDRMEAVRDRWPGCMARVRRPR